MNAKVFLLAAQLTPRQFKLLQKLLYETDASHPNILRWKLLAAQAAIDKEDR